MAQTTLRDRIQSIEDAISAGQIDDAMADCQEILARYPDALEIQRLLGEVYLAQGRLEEAQQTFDWILVNDPENVIAYCDRALICEHLSDIDTALDCYQQAYELSRGNSQIRQEFNQLSAKAGQQEFMLSRAGLARLYMRGDLLTQALQEWEAVLAASPDRLDARLGLMETYWREGINDQVEQMASRILEDVPNCEKALLLMAHVTSAFNMQRARELVQRSELLDPELVMAQELFGDLAASQPHDPFLSIIRRDFIRLNDHRNGNSKQIDAISTHQYTAVEVEDEALAVRGASADRLYNWNAQDALAELDTRTIAQASALPASEATIQRPAQEQPLDDFDAWAAQQEIDDDYDPALLEQQPWFQAEQSTTSSSSGQAQGDSLPGLQDVDDPWNVPTQPREEEVPAPPAWLDMLTRNERRQSEQSVPAPLTPEPEHSYPVYQSRPEAIAVPNQSWDQNVQAVPASPQTDDAMSPFFFGSDDKDEDMGWPEWLKSLGAEAIEPAPPASEAEVQEQASHSAWNDLQQSLSSTSRSPSQSEVAPGQDPWADPPEVDALAAQEPAQYGSWEEQINQTMSEGEREHTATLETLEQSLLSQGFVPLQPGSLSTIAQESGIASSSPSQEPAPEMPVYAPDTLTQQQGVPTPVLASNRVEQATPDTPLSSAYRADALLENELETTMRRPAVRLQPIQKTPTRTDQAYPAGKGRPVDRGAGEGNLSNKERLVKGYQYQLAGAYDDAMQEYRITIRNAPELLGEVISNLRALLKLAPRYTAGFRVLGDAYMRQGEYLQAMEAYNKALTMAKKAKSQSH